MSANWTAIDEAVQAMKGATEMSWEERRARFVADLPELDPAADYAVSQVLPWLDGMSDEQRAVTFHGEELDTTLANLATGHVPAAPDPEQWFAYLREAGTAWDGRGETWAQFSEWFRHYAYEPGFGAYADELMADLDERSDPERLSALAGFGVVISSTTADPDTPWSGEPEDTRGKTGRGRGGGRGSDGGVRTSDRRTGGSGLSEKRGSIGGTGGGDGGDDGRKRGLEKEHELDEAPSKRKRFGRSAPAEADIAPGTLTVTWHRTGAAVQRLDQEQAMGFHQVATLTRPIGSTKRVDNLYAFYQEVRDSKTVHTGETDPLGAFEQDESFEPPYGGETTQRTDSQITFTDDPGWSGDTLVGIGKWVTNYTIEFRWRVRHRLTDQEWVSPTLTHTLTCPYTDGSPTAITATPDGNQPWTVTFPA